jgi:hypothetical protein
MQLSAAKDDLERPAANDDLERPAANEPSA